MTIVQIKYILEIGFEYPEELCNSHNKYPLASKGMESKMFKQWNIEHWNMLNSSEKDILNLAKNKVYG